MSGKKLCVFAFAVLFVLSVSAGSLEELLAAQQMAVDEGGLYTVSPDAFPQGMTLDKLCGIVVPDYITVDEHMRKVPLKETDDIPSSFDWREQGGMTAIRHQGSCGSCWAFAAVGIFESAIKIKDGTGLDLSEQDILNCNSYGYGCNGGWLDCVKYFEDYGMPLEEVEPYVGSENKCNTDLERPYKIIDYGSVSSYTSSIKKAIMQYGPVESVVAADTSFQYYSGGVFNHDNYQSINHAIILCGWDDSLGDGGCWILRNSWGSSWGEDGYMYIEYGNCSVGKYNYSVSY